MGGAFELEAVDGTDEDEDAEADMEKEALVSKCPLLP